MSRTYIAALYVYPVKSCGGIALDRAYLGERGLRLDRQWMVVDQDDKFVTQREYPRLSLVKTALSGENLLLTAPDLPTLTIPIAQHEGQQREVTVWKDTAHAIDEGDDAAMWFSELLDAPMRLVRMPDAFERLTSTAYTSEPGTLGFADGYPLLFISESSLVDLNKHLVKRGKSPVTMDRFRPNVVFGGSAPFAEDTWKQVNIAGIRFDVVKPCARCAITTVEQSLGVVPDVREPLATLATYRRGENGVNFGQNAIHRGCGTLKVGDPVDVQQRR